MEQIKKQLNKLIDIISVRDYTKKDFYDRELILAKVNYSKEIKVQLERLAKKLPVKILSHKENTCIIEATLSQQQLRDLLDFLQKIGVKELVRTGRIAIEP